MDEVKRFSRKAALKVAIPFSNAPVGTCRWCGKPTPKGRPRWCSNVCVNEYRDLAFPNQTRRVVFERADYRCEVCRQDCGHEGRKTVHHPTGRYPNHDLDGKVILELDHTVPLVEGGKHELSNLRALCRSCHKAQTAALAARMAERRKAGLPPKQPRRRGKIGP